MVGAVGASHLQGGLPLPLVRQIVLLAGILLAFGIKIPLVPFHTWLPDAHVEASTPVSVLLAGVLLKLVPMGCCASVWVCFLMRGRWLRLGLLVGLLSACFMGLVARSPKRYEENGSL